MEGVKRETEYLPWGPGALTAGILEPADSADSRFSALDAEHGMAANRTRLDRKGMLRHSASVCLYPRRGVPAVSSHAGGAVATRAAFGSGQFIRLDQIDAGEA